ncbi:hypothetical protein BGW80DRAFT_1257846 [Lactifluus volemus]|nr:hypothetical protein BGW80DRAFT_1257846 [Lactifluus volemus]
MAGGDHNSVRILCDCLFKLERLACVFTWAELLSQWLAKQPQLATFEHGGYPDDDQMRLGTSDATLMGWYYWRILPDILACYEGWEKWCSGTICGLVTLTAQSLRGYPSTSRVLWAFANKAPNLTCLAIYENIDYPAGENKHILRVIKEHFTTLQVSVWAPLHYPVARDEDGYTSSSSGFSIDSCTKEEMYSFDKAERYALAMSDTVISLPVLFISFLKGHASLVERAGGTGSSEPRPFNPRGFQLVY